MTSITDWTFKITKLPITPMEIFLVVFFINTNFLTLTNEMWFYNYELNSVQFLSAVKFIYPRKTEIFKDYLLYSKNDGNALKIFFFYPS